MFQQLFSELSGLIRESALTLSVIVPRLAVALALIAAGIVLAYLVRGLSRRLVRRLIGLIPAREAHRGRSADLRRYADLTISRALFWTVLLLFTFAASESLGLPVVAAWFGGVADYLPRLFAAALIVFAGLVGGRLLGDLITRAAPAAGIVHAKTLGRLTEIAALIVSGLIAVEQAGLSVHFLTNVLLLLLAGGLLGGALTFGLGARATVANILACSQLQKTYQVGQRVRIGDHQGEIVQTTATAVVLDSTEGRVSVPASIFDREVSIRLMERT